VKPDERGFEDAITASLVEAGGYRLCKWGMKPEWAADFDRVRGLDVAELFAFLAETQPKAWERLVAVHGGPDGARAQFAERLAKQLDERGTVDVLRHGVNDHGIEIRIAFFRPAHGLTPELTERYLANRLTVTRQLPYDAAAAKTIDVCLFVNGIPVATAELKNPLTHQAVEHAKHQYRTDRDPA
jgi:type I restriction enzyme, R subunit